jgi:hypothetical protein
LQDEAKFLLYKQGVYQKGVSYRKNYYFCPFGYDYSSERILSKDEVDETTGKEKGSLTNNPVYWVSKETNLPYAGFANKDTHPDGKLCPVCCYAKKETRFNLCLNDEKIEAKPDNKSNLRYIYLTEKTGVPENRFAMLPDVINAILNNGVKLGNKNNKIVTGFNHYLRKGVAVDPFYDIFLNTIGDALDPNALSGLKGKNIRELLLKKLTKAVFSTLKSGSLQLVFQDGIIPSGNAFENFVDFLKGENYINEDFLWDFITTENVLIDSGFNLFIFESPLTKGKITSNVVLKCPLGYDVGDLYNSKKPSLVLYKYTNRYEPIYLIRDNGSVIQSTKMIPPGDPIVDKLIRYMAQCNPGLDAQAYDHEKKIFKKQALLSIKQRDPLILEFEKPYTLQSTFDALKEKKTQTPMINLKKSQKIEILTKNDTANLDLNFQPVAQIIDEYNKAIYLVIKNGLKIPVKPSSRDSRLPLRVYTDFPPLGFLETLQYLKAITTIPDTKLPLEPVLILTVLPLTPNPTQSELDNRQVTGILLKCALTIEVAPGTTASQAKEQISLVTNKNIATDLDYYENSQYYSSRDGVDHAIANLNKSDQVDQRLSYVNLRKFEDESYQRLRYELSKELQKLDPNLGYRSPVDEIRRLVNTVANNLLQATLFVELKDDIYKDPFYNEIKKVLLEVSLANLSSSAKAERLRSELRTLLIGDKYAISLVSQIMQIVNDRVKKVTDKHKELFKLLIGPIEKITTSERQKEYDYNHYVTPNTRTECQAKSSEDCQLDPHCEKMDDNQCQLFIEKDNLLFLPDKKKNNINRYLSLIIEELLKSHLKRMELLDDQVDNTVNPNIFEYREDEVIFREPTYKANKKRLENLYKKDVDYYERLSKLYDTANPLSVQENPQLQHLVLDEVTKSGCHQGFANLTVHWKEIISCDGDDYRYLTNDGSTDCILYALTMALNEREQTIKSNTETFYTIQEIRDRLAENVVNLLPEPDKAEKKGREGWVLLLDHYRYEFPEKFKNIYTMKDLQTYMKSTFHQLSLIDFVMISQLYDVKFIIMSGGRSLLNAPGYICLGSTSSLSKDYILLYSREKLNQFHIIANMGYSPPKYIIKENKLPTKLYQQWYDVCHNTDMKSDIDAQIPALLNVPLYISKDIASDEAFDKAESTGKLKLLTAKAKFVNPLTGEILVAQSEKQRIKIQMKSEIAKQESKKLTIGLKSNLKATPLITKTSIGLKSDIDAQTAKISDEEAEKDELEAEMAAAEAIEAEEAEAEAKAKEVADAIKLEAKLKLEAPSSKKLAIGMKSANKLTIGMKSANKLTIGMKSGIKPFAPKLSPDPTSLLI